MVLDTTLINHQKLNIFWMVI